ncbi:efflux RND transporter periplasmic adaptor subunit [Flavobacterium sp. Fl-318]|uniref:Efflux RND transporter periplasmic adaptor subunit n=1 Tax=Flavobacterium cupriresistens TaxID=2893885 RepID=A0ABU4R9B2_9FLAO|nr:MULTISPECIES: efflux RND transporter periplasmic adaptor subunit [unclassified Flavobacterium]MDX6189173.1 efflux RND transporter periplasmic adaptor subunit [Flavobacterium sp. Fl-318]UFH41270.1 efflux RND transporter periplasmic adaptor subunit [Flavobacterium sp. F-323]
MKHISFSLLAIMLVFASCKKKEEQAPPQGPAPFPVKTVTIQNATVYQDYTANLEGQQNVEIRPKVNGFIQKIYVDEGQVVKKGQLLFKLETQTLNEDASAAKAAVQAAQVEVDRLKPLVDRKIISVVQLETAKAKLAQAKSTYGSIVANIGYATIYSPVNGVIGGLPFREGSLVSATNEMPLTTVSDTKIVRAYFSMNEKQLLFFNKTFKGATTAEKLKAAPLVSLILVDNSEYDQKGRIATMNGLVNAQTGTTQFRAEFANPEGILRSGSTGIIRLPIEEKDVILVPQNAVFEVQGKQTIYVVEKGNKVKSRIIETNGTTALNYIVSSGLKEGEIVVIEGASKLKDDAEITPQQAKDEAVTTANTNSSAKK